MKKLFLVVTIMLSTAQMLVDSLNQLNLPDESRTIAAAVLMLSILFLDGARRFFDPSTQTNTLWVTAGLFAIYFVGALADHANYLADLGVNNQALAYMRLGFSIIIITLNQTIQQLGDVKQSSS
jgi:CDP-diglyceride synthetase